MVDIAKAVKADIIEFHTGKYANLSGIEQRQELEKLIIAIKYAHNLKLNVMQDMV